MEKEKGFNLKRKVLLRDIQEKSEINGNPELNPDGFFLGIIRKHSDCALFRFYLTLTYLDAIKSKQVPAQVSFGKIWGQKPG